MYVEDAMLKEKPKSGPRTMAGCDNGTQNYVIISSW